MAPLVVGATAITGLGALAVLREWPAQPEEPPVLSGPTGRTHTTSVLVSSPMTLIELSGGTFEMGRDDEASDDDRLSRHNVRVSPFFMGQTEVTQAQWTAGINAAQGADYADAKSLNIDPSYLKGPNLPVDRVSWCDTAHFANALSLLEHLTPAYAVGPDCESGGEVAWDHDATGYRLPTEAEWEYAARAGTTTAYATGDTEVALARVGWYDQNSGGHPHEVCTAERPWGLCDLHGNVREWVWDWYGPYRKPSADGPADNPTGAPWVLAGPNTRVVRGGSCLSAAGAARTAYRSAGIPNIHYNAQGFRLVLPSPPPAQQTPSGTL